MKEEYKEAFSEVDQIFYLMPSGILDKIPSKFKELIKNNKSNTYMPNIQEPFENCKLKYETHVILALIYRDFLCSKEEREELVKRDTEKISEFEKELRDKYNIDNVFKSRKNNSQSIDENIFEETAIIEYKEKNFIQKLFDKIKHLFRRS